MRYILANNATARLAAGISDADTAMAVEDISGTMAGALGGVSATSRVLVTLASVDESLHEVVEISAWDEATATATIIRGQDESTAQAWASGTALGVRMGRKQAQSLHNGHGANSAQVGGYAGGEGSVAIGAGADAIGKHAISIGNSYVGAPESVAVGLYAGVHNSGKGVAIGRGASIYNEEHGGIAIGIDAAAFSGGIAIGSAEAGDQGNIAIGDASVWSDDAIVLGFGYAGGGDDRSVIIGNMAVSTGGGSPDGVFIGYNANGAGATASVGIGKDVEVTASVGVALGAQASCRIPTGAHFAGLFYQPKTAALPETLAHASDTATRHRASPLTTLASGILDMTDGAGAQEIDLPAGTHFFPDRIDIIATEADSPSGAAINVGTDASTDTDSLLSSQAITLTGAHQREVFVPVSPHGITHISIGVATAGTGVLKCRVIVSGYLVEDE